MPTSSVGVTSEALGSRMTVGIADGAKRWGQTAQSARREDGERFRERSRRLGTEWSVPNFSRSAGVTLIEMLIVMALIALVAGMAAPSVSAGLDSLRLRSTSDAIIGFLNSALARADTRQQVVEILISPQDGTITATSGDQGFKKRLDIVSPIKILSVQPALAADAQDQNQTRRFLMYPGGSVPKIAIEIVNSRGRKRLVSIDPVTGVPQSAVEGSKTL